MANNLTPTKQDNSETVLFHYVHKLIIAHDLQLGALGVQDKCPNKEQGLYKHFVFNTHTLPHLSVHTRGHMPQSDVMDSQKRNVKYTIYVIFDQ